MGSWHGGISILQLLCWLSVVAALWLAWKRINGFPFSPRPAMRAFLYAPGIVGAAALIYVLAGQSFTGRPERRSAQAAVASLRALNYVRISEYLNQHARYSEAAAAEREALRVTQNSPEAFNGLAVADRDLRKLAESQLK
jgi:hypothetical protein